MLFDFSDYIVPVHRDGRKFVFAAAAVAVLVFLLWPFVGLLIGFFALWVAYFFRDPARVTPVREGLIVAPADGTVIGIEMVKAPKELGFGEVDRLRISTHLSMLDVHVNRSPAGGRIVRSIYIPGAYFNPTLEKSSEENERRATVIALQDETELAVVQIAGVVARRIVTFASEGDTLASGQRIGLIRFGSRVDLYLPPGTASLVCAGQRMVAGETVVADRSSEEPSRDGRRT